MSTRRKRAVKGKAAAAPQATADTDAVILDASQASQMAEEPPPPSPSVAAMAAKAAATVGKALRSSARGMLGLTDEPTEHVKQLSALAEGPGAPPDQLGAGGGGGDDDDINGRAAPDPHALAAGAAAAAQHHHLDQDPLTAPHHPGGGAAQSTPRMTMPPAADDPLLREPGDDDDDDDDDDGGGPSAADFERGGHQQPAHQHDEPHYNHQPRLLRSLAGIVADWQSVAAPLLHAAKERVRSPQISPPHVLPLLPIALCLLLLTQHVALRKQSHVLSVYRQQLAAQAEGVEALQSQLAALQTLLSHSITPNLKQVKSQADECAANVGSLGTEQQGLAAKLTALQTAAARMAKTWRVGGAAGGGDQQGGSVADAEGVTTKDAAAAQADSGGDDDAALAALWLGAARGGKGPAEAAGPAAVHAQVEGLLRQLVPPPDLALAACGATVAAHSPVALDLLPWLQAARLRLRQQVARWGRAPGGRGAVHPAADALLLTARMLPERCLPLALASGKPAGAAAAAAAAAAPAFVEIQLPGLANVSAVELHLMLAKGNASAATDLGTRASEWVLPSTAPREVRLQLFNATTSAGLMDERREATSRGVAEPAAAVFSAAVMIDSMEKVTRGPGARAKVEIPVVGSIEGGDGGGGGDGAAVASNRVRVEVASGQGEGAGFVCLYRLAVRGVPVGGGSFC